MAIQVVGVDNVVNGLTQVAENLSPGRMMETMGEVNEVLEEAHRASYGHVRKDLPQTLERHPDSDGRLVETGALKASLTQSDAPGAVREITPYSATFGTSLFYGRFAQHGTPTEKKRKIVRFTPATRKAVRAVVDRRMYRGAEGLAEDA